MMQVVLSTPGRFHTFSLAKELMTKGLLSHVVSGFPRSKLAREGIPDEKLLTCPFYTYAQFGFDKIGFAGLARESSFRKILRVDSLSTSVLTKTHTDIYMALSSTGYKSGPIAKLRGASYICDRGSSHIVYQRNILGEEYGALGLKMPSFDERIVERELFEYSASDIVTVPSEFVRRSFLAMGFDEKKVAKLPYGANLANFYPTTRKDDNYFDVLYVGALSARKGLIYLFQAFEKLKCSKKRLTLIGPPTQDFSVLRRYLPTGDVRVLGAIPSNQLKHYMSSSHVKVLASIEEGLALVMGEALACGCPVIATVNTGAEDLYTDGIEGFIVPIRDADAISARLQILADDQLMRRNMSVAARAKMENIGGWKEYGINAINLFERIRPSSQFS